MAHKIEFNVKSGTHSMVSVKEIPWHGLGQIVEEAMTSEEAIKLANLDYEVVKIPNYCEYEGSQILSPDSFTTIRTDTKIALGAVGKDYTVIQNSKAFVFFDTIVGEGAAIFQTAGVLGKGEQMFVTAKLPQSIVLDNVDEIKQYLLLSNSHDGSRSIECMFTPIRVVCNNTLTAALSSAKNRVKIRHTVSADVRLQEAYKLLGIHTELLQEQEFYFNMLKEKQITEKEFKTYVCNVLLTPGELIAVAKAGFANIGDLEEVSTRKLNMMNEIAEYYEYGPGQRIVTAKETLWGAYNAITGYYHNAKEYSDNTKKVMSNYYGNNWNVMHSAYKLAVDMAYDKITILN